jgi:hypothetical protein
MYDTHYVCSLLQNIHIFTCFIATSILDDSRRQISAYEGKSFTPATSEAGTSICGPTTVHHIRNHQIVRVRLNPT